MIMIYCTFRMCFHAHPIHRRCWLGFQETRAQLAKILGKVADRAEGQKALTRRRQSCEGIDILESCHMDKANVVFSFFK